MSKAKNPEYTRFIDVQTKKVDDNIPLDKETIATAQEIGWRKKFQVVRAIGHARRDEATPVELSFLARHIGYFYPKTPKYLRRKKSQ